MKKFALALLLVAAAVSVAPCFSQRATFDLEALYNGSGDFRGCPYSGSDCMAF